VGTADFHQTHIRCADGFDLFDQLLRYLRIAVFVYMFKGHNNCPLFVVGCPLFLLIAQGPACLKSIDGSKKTSISVLP
jgi:hypothetical protein